MDQRMLKDEIVELGGELLEGKHLVRFRMRGHSMYPVFKDGDIGTVEKCDPAELKRGDIIVFRQGDNLVAHRLVKALVRDGGLLLIARGDRNRVADKPFAADQLIGKIVSFQKGKRVRSVDAPLFRFAGFCIGRFGRVLVPFFNIMLRIKTWRQKIPGAVRSFASNMKFIAGGSGRLLSVNLLIASLQGILPLAVIFCLKWLIDSLTAAEPGDPATFRPFLVILAITALTFLANAVVSSIRNYWFEKLSFSVSMRIYDRLHRKHENLAMGYYEDATMQDKIHRAVQEAGFRPVKICNELLQMVRSVISGIVIIALFFTIKWYLALALLPAILPGIIVRLRHSRELYRLKRENSPTERETYYYNRVLTALPFAKELKLFAFGRFFRHRFRRSHETLFGRKDRLNRSVLWYDIAAQTFSVLVVFGVFGYIAWLAVTGHSTIGTVAMSFLIFHRGYSVLGELSKSATQLVEDNIFLNDLIDFITLPGKGTEGEGETGGAGEVTVPAGADLGGDVEGPDADKMVKEGDGETADGPGIRVPGAAADIQGSRVPGEAETGPGQQKDAGDEGATFPRGGLKKGIFVRDLSFRYKPEQKMVLEDVSFDIPAGKAVAFTGRNGSGKTTMVKLLCGFYRPISGKIMFDDTDTALLAPETMREGITAVFQDFALYNLTAFENIMLGDISRDAGRKAAREAAEKAGIIDVIQKMPRGLDNMLGPLFGGGQELSIGQWQKFAIARAFYRDAPILIFDEPSSALDAETERQVLQRLRELASDRTVIMVSHRPAATDWADIIYSFEEGKVRIADRKGLRGE
ncbi:MAG: signal peptidase I [Marinilabiliales bacterium]|nr:MAG: signal peptidase I [Marinilabiliales bacterium]